MRDGLFVFDAHTHIFRDYKEVNGRPSHYTVSHMLERMDQFGIDKSFVIAHGRPGWRMADYVCEHDALVEDLALAPERLVGCCWANPHFGNEMVGEVDRCLGQLGYRGIKLHPVMDRFYEDDEALVYPVVELARHYSVPVVLHTEMPWRVIFLAQDFPDVTFIIAHLGAGHRKYVQDLSVARLATRVSNVVLETSSTTTDPYATYAGPAKLVGADRVLFGSDAGPFHHPAVNLAKIDVLDMPRDEKALILGGNMQAILEAQPNIERGRGIRT